MSAVFQTKSVEIAQSEQAMPWPLLYLADDWSLRYTILIWARDRARRIPTKAIAENHGWPHSSLRERRDRAARIIAGELNRAGVLPW